jgi:hypothetical protein
MVFAVVMGARAILTDLGLVNRSLLLLGLAPGLWFLLLHIHSCRGGKINLRASMFSFY